MKIKHIMLLLAAIALIVSGCGTPAREQVHEPVNSVYYWKTVFKLKPYERRMLERHDIGRMYMRFFDVVCEDRDLTGVKSVVPAATIQFRDTLPPVEVVPTVYITLDAMRAMYDSEAHWAGVIANRLLNMCSYNGIDSVREVQLDCDWTPSTRESYFKLCRNMGDSLRSRHADMRVSATIRLHQLGQPAPPVDCGVLMVYNTGSFRDPQSHNSIIDLDDIEPYLRKNSSYSLPLDFAYPAYSWGLVFRGGQFKCLMRDISCLADTSIFAVDGNHATVKQSCVKENIGLAVGDRIRIETSPFDEIDAVKHAVESRLAPREGHYSTIIYHLDSLNFSNFTDEEIQKIYSHGNR